MPSSSIHTSPWYLAAFGLVATIAFILLIHQQRPVEQAAPDPLTGPMLVDLPLEELPTHDYREITARVMDRCGVKLSPAMFEARVEQIATVVEREYSGNVRGGEAYIALLCIESKFDPSAKSPVGATGMAQIMPQYAQSFSSACGFGQLTASDLSDAQFNIRLGACHFHSLLTQFNGNVALALAGYNSGAGSSTTRALGKLGTGVEETSGYLAKHYVLTQSVGGNP